jgi:hypothetical protein
LKNIYDVDGDLWEFMTTFRFVLKLYRSSKWATVFFYFNFENYSWDVIYTQQNR